MILACRAGCLVTVQTLYGLNASVSVQQPGTVLSHTSVSLTHISHTSERAFPSIHQILQ